MPEASRLPYPATIAHALGAELDVGSIDVDPRTLDDILDDVLRIGEQAGCADAARRLVVDLRGRYWTAIDHVNGYVEGPEIVVLEGIDPIVVGGRWVPELVRAAGGRYTLNEPGEPAKTIAPEELLAALPDRIIVCGDDLDLDAAAGTAWWPLLPAVQDGQVVLDSRAALARPGVHLVEVFRWLVAWVNDAPELGAEGVVITPAG